MESFETLLMNKEYQKILQITERSSDPTSIFARISALICLKKYKEAKALFNDKLPQLFANKPIKTIDSYFEFLILTNDFDEAYEKEKWFEDQPYISQEVEESIRRIPSLIRAGEKLSVGSKPLGEETVHERLKGDDNYLLLSSLAMLDAVSLPSFEGDLGAILVSSKPDIIKTYALLVLVQYNVSTTFKLKKNGMEMSLVPSSLKKPFSGKNYLLAKEKLLESKDPSTSKKAESLLDYALLSIYPLDLEEYDGDSIAKASFALASLYLGDEQKEKELTEKGKEAFSLIKKLNEEAEPLTL